MQLAMAQLRFWRWIPMVLAVIVLIVSPESFAKKKKRKSKKSQRGVVSVEGATVYKKADFDATIVDYLQKGKKYRISRKLYEGAGGIGLFYKIRLKKKKYGYIANNEIIPQLKANVSNNKKVEEVSNPVFDQAIDQEPGSPEQNTEPMYFRKYWGPVLGSVNYTEEFEGETLSSFEPMLGVKFTGPGVVFDGPPVDLEIMFGFSAPSYYQAKFADSASGFYSVGHLMLINPLSDSKTGMLYYGFGIMYNFSAFQIEIDAVEDRFPSGFDSQVLRGGIALSVGYAFNLGTQALRLEGKYYYESQSFVGVGLSYQFGL